MESGGPGGGCAGDEFCDTFEREDRRGPWVFDEVQDGATLAIDRVTSTSPTRSLHMYLPSTPGARAYLARGADRVRLSFSMKTPAPDRRAVIARIQFGHSNGVAEIASLSLDDGRLLFSEETIDGDGGVDSWNAAVAGFLPDRWQRWTLNIDASGDTTRLTLRVDGSDALVKTLTSKFRIGDVSVLLGCIYQVPGPPRDVRYDDVGIQTAR